MARRPGFLPPTAPETQTPTAQTRRYGSPELREMRDVLTPGIGSFLLWAVSGTQFVSMLGPTLQN